MPGYAKTVYVNGDVITAAKLNNAENGIAAAVPLDGSVAMTAQLTAPAVKVASGVPVLILADTTAAQPWGQVRVEDGFLYIDQLTNAGAYNATRIKIDLLTGVIYTGAALDQRMATEKFAIAMAVLGG